MNRITVEVMSGIHAGAVWEFTSGEVSIGGNSKCSVFLCDNEMPDFCLIFKMIGNRVALLHVDADLEGAEEIKSRLNKWIYPDLQLKAKIGEVELKISILDLSGLIFQKIANASGKLVAKTADSIQQIGVKLVVGVSCTLALLSTVTLLFFGVPVGDTNASDSFEVLYQDRVKSAITESLSSANILKAELDDFASYNGLSFDELSASDNRVHLKASMSRAQIKLFEKKLPVWAEDYGNQVRFDFQISMSEEQKTLDQIQIKGVSFGQQPVVMLEGGRRLFVGAMFEGMQLIEVSPRRLVFRGNSEYSVPL